MQRHSTRRKRMASAVLISDWHGRETHGKNGRRINTKSAGAARTGCWQMPCYVRRFIPVIRKRRQWDSGYWTAGWRKPCCRLEWQPVIMIRDRTDIWRPAIWERQVLPISKPPSFLKSLEGTAENISGPLIRSVISLSGYRTGTAGLQNAGMRTAALP